MSGEVAKCHQSGIEKYQKSMRHAEFIGLLYVLYECEPCVVLHYFPISPEKKQQREEKENCPLVNDLPYALNKVVISMSLARRPVQKCMNVHTHTHTRA
jgi:hypothetical protein